MYPILNTFSKLSTEEIVEKITRIPRLILGVSCPKIEEESIANLTIFDDSKEWELEEKMIVSKSKNTPFIGKLLKGRAVAIFNKGEFRTV